jgi:hypothetical protein
MRWRIALRLSPGMSWNGRLCSSPLISLAKETRRCSKDSFTGAPRLVFYFFKIEHMLLMETTLKKSNCYWQRRKSRCHRPDI